jgi:hypothetical protein
MREPVFTAHAFLGCIAGVYLLFLLSLWCIEGTRKRGRARKAPK